MFRPRGLFSGVACPNLDTCHIPQCIFSHDAASGMASATNNPDEIALDEDEDDQHVQKKRRKLDEHSLSPRSVQNMRVKATSNITKPIPPPLRRKVTPASRKPTPVAPKVKPVPEAPLKVESLNPRALKSAPAAHDIRYRLIRALNEQFVRLNTEVAKDASDAEKDLVLSDQAMITKALDIEEEAASSAVYSNVVKNKIMFYKRMSVNDWVEERKKDVAKAKSLRKPISIDAPKGLGPPAPLDSGLNADDELKLLGNLHSNIYEISPILGFATKVATTAEIDVAMEKLDEAQGWEKCERCKTRFQVFPGRRVEDGALTDGGQCTYHHGKSAYNAAGSIMDPKAKRVKRWSCCGQEMGDSMGCVHSACHVFKIHDIQRVAAVCNFVKTPENVEKVSDRPICLDAEMGYTVYGLELIRLTATSWPSGDEIFDVLVKPMGGVLDLNTRWSGVYPEDMAEALPWAPDVPEVLKDADGKKRLRMVDSLQAARDLLFSHISPQTPVIGHGLENDFIAARVIHPTIIDTSILFPHPVGLPYRNSLKNLTKLHLKREIQKVIEGEVGGHDSKEDANAAGDLVRFALKKEWQKLKKEGWILKDGEFKPPTPKEPFLLLDEGHYFNVRDTGEEVEVPTGPRKRVRDDGGEGRASFGPEVPTRPRKRSRAEAMDSLRSSSPVAPLSRPESMSIPNAEEEELDY